MATKIVPALREIESGPVNRGRLRLLEVWLLGTLVILGARLGYLQIARHHDWQRTRERQSHRTEILVGARGRILDRDMVTLAENKPSGSVYADPAEVVERAAVAESLSRVLRIPAEDILRKLQSKGRFVWLARQVDHEMIDRLAKLNLRGIGLVAAQKRTYPSRDMASQVLGFAGVDMQGLAGVELQYDTMLRGRDGLMKYYVDALGRKIASEREFRSEARPGVDLRLAVSREVQGRIEQDLRRYAFKYGLLEGVVIAIKARDGEILVMANYPSYDPNRYRDYGPTILNKNLAVHEALEPTQIVAVMLVAAGLDTRSVRFEREEGGWGRVGDYLLGFERHNGEQVVLDLVRRVGEDVVARYLRLFGIGQPTGVDLPGESAGALEEKRLFSTGAGVRMTALQITSVVAALLNEGVGLRPRVVQGHMPEVAPVPQEGKTGRKILLKGTAKVMTNVLRRIVKEGDGVKADLEGYEIGGIGFVGKGDHGRNNIWRGFVGFQHKGVGSEDFVVLAMARAAAGGRTEGISGVSKDLFRSTVYEVLRYQEGKYAGVRAKDGRE